MAEEALSKYSCVGVIFYISPNSLLSSAVANEIAFVKKLGKDFLSINLPIKLDDGSEKICSAVEMLDVLEKQNPISQTKRNQVTTAFNEKVIFLGYGESTEIKAEKIKLLKRPDLFEFEKIYCEHTESVGEALVLNSVNSLDVKTVEIPRSVFFEGDVRNVIKIGECAFANCKNLKSVKISDQIDIGKNAFYGCRSLEKIEAESLGSIEENAFGLCGSLSELPKLNGTVKTNAFFGCTALKEVTLGNDFYSDMPGIFAGSGIEWLKREEFEEESYTYTRNLDFDCSYDYLLSFERRSIEGIQKKAKLLYARPDSSGFFDVPFRTENVMCGFLSNPALLRRITIPSSVKTIEERAFSKCRNLEEIVFAENKDGTLEIKKGAFYNTLKLDRISIPMQTELIGESAFERSALKEISFAENCRIRVIGEAAFKNCKNLKAVSLPKDLQEIRRYAFQYCQSLESIDISGKIRVVENKAFADCSALREVSLGEGIVFIGVATFWRCKSLVSINLPQSLKQISDSAFSGCENLREINLPDGLEVIGVHAFDGCDITEITLPAGLKKINSSAIFKIPKINFLGTLERWNELLSASHGRVDNHVYCSDGVYGE